MRYIIFFVMVLAPNILCASDWTYLVLKVEKLDELGAGRLLVKMVNGDTVSVAAENVDDMMTKITNKVKDERGQQTSTDEPTSSTASTNSESVIRSHCKAEWPTDFKMQKYCIDQQEAALKSLSSRSMRGELAGIRAKCSGEWPDDYKMRNYCEEQQIKAYEKLKR